MTGTNLVPDWMAWVIAAAPVLTIVGGGVGAYLTFRVQARQVRAQVMTAEAAHEAAHIAGRKAAIDEIAELRQHWTAIIATVTSDNASVRSENAQIKADLAALHARHSTDVLEITTKLQECEALSAALVHNQQALIDRMGAVEREQGAGGGR